MFRDNSGWEDPKGAQPWEPKPAQRKPERGEFKKQLKAKQALRSQEQQQRRYDESFAPPASRPETKRIHGRPAAFPYEQRVSKSLLPVSLARNTTIQEQLGNRI